MYRRHNFETRLNVISRIMSGEPIKSVCRALNLDKNIVRQWMLRYQKYGEEGLRGTRSYYYTTAEKLKIVEDFTIKGVPLQKLCLRYDLNRSTIQKWVRTVRQGLSLNNKRRGRPPKIWQDQRKENHRPNLRNFRQRTYA